jgi:hypothetical protein
VENSRRLFERIGPCFQVEALLIDSFLGGGHSDQKTGIPVEGWPEKEPILELFEGGLIFFRSQSGGPS